MRESAGELLYPVSQRMSKFSPALPNYFLRDGSVVRLEVMLQTRHHNQGLLHQFVCLAQFAHCNRSTIYGGKL